MNKRRRLERLEAASGGGRRETPDMALELYLKALENHRREQAGEPPIPLTEEEERYEREMDNDPEFQRYWQLLEEQRIQQQERSQSWHGET